MKMPIIHDGKNLMLNGVVMPATLFASALYLLEKDGYPVTHGDASIVVNDVFRLFTVLHSSCSPTTEEGG